MPHETIELLFPVGGLSRLLAYQKQPPFTTPDALNVRARETLEGRIRGGSRPGLLKAFPQLLGSGSPVRLINSVREITPTGGNFIVDQFSSGDEVTDNTIWTTAAWKSNDPAIRDGYAYGQLDFADVGVVLNALSPTMDVTTAAYTLTLNILTMPFAVDPNRNAVEVFLRMADSSPNAPMNGVIVRAETYNSGSAIVQNLSLLVYSGGVLVESYSDGQSGFPLAASPTILKVIVNETGAAANRVHVTWTQGTVLDVEIDQVVSTAAAGQRVGFGIVAPGSQEVQIESFSLNYTNTGGTGSFNRNRIIVGAGTKLYEEDNSGNLIDTGATLTAQTNPLHSVDRLGQLYVADQAEGKLKVYSPVAGTYIDVALVAGTIPTKCVLIALYQDCIVLANQQTSGLPATAPSPHMWYMSRRGAPGDYDFSVSDVAGAVAGTNAEFAGQLPGPITSLLGFTDDYLIFGSHRSIFVLRGHPRVGGYMDTLSHDIGIIDGFAWCRGSTNQVSFLAHDGVYAMASGESGYSGGIGIEPTSRAKLPRELINIDVVNNHVSMAHDVEERGIDIYITPRTPGSGGGHWYLELEGGSFWPIEQDSDTEPTAMVYYKSDNPMQSGVMLGGRDGYVRKFSSMAENDDGENFESYVDYGPIMLHSNPSARGAVHGIVGVLDEQSNPAQWSIRSGNSPEEAFNATARTDATGTWVAGRNFTRRPRCAGACAFLRVSGIGGKPWAIDSVFLDREKFHSRIRL